MTDGVLIDQRLVDAILTRHLLAYSFAETGQARVASPMSPTMATTS
jgi:hypothetical protein